MGNCCGACNPFQTDINNDTEPVSLLPNGNEISVSFSNSTLNDGNPIHKIMDIVGNDFDRLQVMSAYQLNGKDPHSTIHYLYNNGYTNIGDIGDYTEQVDENKYDYNIKPKLMDCIQLNRLKKVFLCVDHGDYKLDLEDVNISQVVDDYLYLLQHHNKDDEFEIIYSELGGFCNIQTCDIFKRNHNNSQTITGYDTCYYQILDKIHCYYSHTFDMGYRLNQNERSLLNNVHNEINTGNELDSDESLELLATTNILSKYTEMLNTKGNIFREYTENMEGFSNRNMSKYCQLYQQQHTKQTKTDQNEGRNNNNKIYGMGYLFIYGYDGEHIWNEKAIKVEPKFDSLKDELLNNDIATMSMSQFEHEIEKAMVYFDSYYRKEHYAKIMIDNILSLMIYCNYDTLQREFSKTYRSKDTTKHNMFYHLGRNIKIGIHEFGTTIPNGHVKVFYHGIGEQLLFPAYIGEMSSGIFMYSPLSTSSSFCVATNFTNGNHGMIVYFGGEWNEQHALSPNKYFPVSWLSNYGNESECLFIQSDSELHINNIIDVRSGSEFKFILFSLRIIEVITSRLTMKEKITKSMNGLLIKIIHHQLSYKPFVSLNDYGKKLVNIYCNNKEWIEIDYLEQHNKDYKFFFDLFFYSQYQWIKIGLICILFPNLKEIQIRNIDLCQEIFNAILSNLENDQINHLELRKLTIFPNINSKLKIIDAMELYKDKLLKLQFAMQEQSGWLKILKIEDDNIEGNIVETAR